MNRKNFIQSTCLLCLGGGAASILAGCINTNYFAKSTFANDTLTIKKTEFVIVDKKSTKERSYVILKTDKLNFPLCIYKLKDGNYSALLMECTHQGCELQPNGNFLVCPCHGSEFNKLGVVQNPPAEANLKTFIISTDHENINIKL